MIMTIIKLYNEPLINFKLQQLCTVMLIVCVCVCESHSFMSDSLRPHGLYSPWNSPGQNTGVGSLFLLQC